MGTPVGDPRLQRRFEIWHENTGPRLFRLVALMHSKNESVAVRAVEAILDRGYGRALQAMDLTEKTSPQEPPCDYSKLTDEEWRSLLHARETMRPLIAKARGEGPSVRTI